MNEVELAISTTQTSTIIRAVESVLEAEGLTQTLEGTLTKYPGCTHWHYKKNKAPGTLEITWWPQEKRLWLKVAANRRAAWIDEVIPRLKQSIESHL